MANPYQATVLLKNMLKALLLSIGLTYIMLPLFYNKLKYGAVGGLSSDMLLVDALFNLGLATMSLTILLNSKQLVRQNYLLRALSFFLLPTIFVAVQFFVIFKTYFCFSEAVLSFYIIQLVFFIRFSRSLKKN